MFMTFLFGSPDIKGGKGVSQAVKMPYESTHSLIKCAMSFGPRTITEQLAQKLIIRWVPKWYEVFYDKGRGLFHERLTKGFKPVTGGQLRLLTQCRQLAVYSHASLQKSIFKFEPDLRLHFTNMRRSYYIAETGGWRFSLREDGEPQDVVYDLYTISFVIFALGHYYRATQDEDAHALALSTLQFIDKNFRIGTQPGYVESLDQSLKPLPGIRRQNPHMHLLEACLFATDIWNDALFSDIASDMVGLFFRYFYDAEKRSLYEWFQDDLSPHPEKGRVVEPGHYYEWIWLLKKYARQQGEPELFDAVCFNLLDWANTNGWDHEYGGIYDELDVSGAVISATKRIWPFTEALKANALMLKDRPIVRQERKQRIADMTALFKNRYIEERGFWTERLNRDLTPASDTMPGTTPYHVYFGIMETRDILRARGKNMSCAPMLYGIIYSVRRKLSALVRAVRERLALTF
jgi:mannose-6-phosphate isomerase